MLEDLLAQIATKHALAIHSDNVKAYKVKILKILHHLIKHDIIFINFVEGGHYYEEEEEQTSIFTLFVRTFKYPFSHRGYG